MTDRNYHGNRLWALTGLEAEETQARRMPAPELYCELLEHKWYMSEEKGRDVGHEAALDDFLERRG